MKDFLIDVINKCSDQSIQQPPITSLIAFKAQYNAIIELQSPELATACLTMNGMPYQGASIGVCRPTEYNEEDCPKPEGPIPVLQLEKIGYQSKTNTTTTKKTNDDVRCKVFVGNLSDQISEDSLEQLFSSFGAIKSVTIPLDPDTNEPKDYGYVVYEDPAVVSTACSELNGMDIHDRALLVRPVAQKQLTTTARTESGETVTIDSQVAATFTFDMPNIKGYIAESDKTRETAAKLLKQAGISTGSGNIRKTQPSRILILRNIVTKEDLEVICIEGFFICRTRKTT